MNNSKFHKMKIINLKRFFCTTPILIIIFFLNFSGVTISGYIINCEVQDIKEGTIMVLWDIDKESGIGKSVVRNGKFQFTSNIKLEEPNVVWITTIYVPQNPEYRKTLVFILDNGIINIKSDFENFKYAEIKGNKIYDYRTLLLSQTLNYEKKIDSIYSLYKDKTRDALEIQKQENIVVKKRDSIVKNFIQKHPNNYYSLCRLTNLTPIFTKEELKNIYQAMDKELQETIRGKKLNEKILLPSY